MSIELAQAIMRTVKSELENQEVNIQKPYTVEPPWQCDSLTNILQAIPAAADVAVVWTRRPVAANRIGIVSHIGWNMDAVATAAIAGVETFWMEITSTPGVPGNGQELDTQFNRRTMGSTGRGRSAGLLFPLPLYNLFIWPGQTAQLNFNWGAAPGGIVQGSIWCWEMSQEYIPKRFQR